MRKVALALTLSLALIGSANAEYIGGYSYGVVPGSGGGGAPPLSIDVTQPPYSAACNGSTNDTSAFNSALTAASAAGGGVVTAPDGRICTIQTGTSISLQNNTCIKGNFTLRGTSATNNTEMILAINKVNACVEDVTIDMIDSFVDGNINNAAISAFGASITATTLRVQNVKIVNMGAFGLLGNGGTYWFLDNRITMNAPYGASAGVGRQTQSIQIACSNISTGIIDGNVVTGSGTNFCGTRLTITNNRITTWNYGAGIGHGGLGLPCDQGHLLGVTGCGSVIANNIIRGGIGIDENSVVNSGMEVYDPQNTVVGNHISSVAATGIVGGGAVIANNVISDVCKYYADNAAFPGGCDGVRLRNDGSAGDAGSYATVSTNRIYGSFGPVLTVTGTTNAAGVIQIQVASTATVGATNVVAPCRVINVGGTTNANKGWLSCKVISATLIELTGSVFNAAWTSGGTIGPMHDYAINEDSASMPGIKYYGNSLAAGMSGTFRIQNPGTSAAGVPCAAPCSPVDGAVMIGLASNQLYVPRIPSGDWTISNTGVATLATVNASPGTVGSATNCAVITSNGKGLITADSETTCTPAVGSITGLGTGVATWLATPSSANLASAVTGETGSGALVFATSPSLTTPNIGVASGTALAVGPSGDAISASVAAASLARVASFLMPSMSNGQRVYMTLGTANSSNNAFFHGYNHDSTTANRYFAIQPFEGGFGQFFNVYADRSVSVGNVGGVGFGAGNLQVESAIKSQGTGGVGYATGAGTSVTQITSRTTGVTANAPTGQITLVSAAGSTTPASFTVTNSTVAVTDTVIINQRSGTDLYEIHITAVAAGSFRVSFWTTGGTTVETPIFNFTVIKGVSS